MQAQAKQAGEAIQSQQLWIRLTPEQQQQVSQTLVAICQQLIAQLEQGNDTANTSEN